MKWRFIDELDPDIGGLVVLAIFGNRDDQHPGSMSRHRTHQLSPCLLDEGGRP